MVKILKNLIIYFFHAFMWTSCYFLKKKILTPAAVILFPDLGSEVLEPWIVVKGVFQSLSIRGSQHSLLPGWLPQSSLVNKLACLVSCCRTKSLLCYTPSKILVGMKVKWSRSSASQISKFLSWARLCKWIKEEIKDKMPSTDMTIHCLPFCPPWINLTWSRSEGSEKTWG